MSNLKSRKIIYFNIANISINFSSLYINLYYLYVCQFFKLYIQINLYMKKTYNTQLTLKCFLYKETLFIKIRHVK